MNPKEFVKYSICLYPGPVSDRDQTLKHYQLFIYIFVFIVSGINLGLAISVLTLIKSRDPVNLFLYNGIAGILNAFFCGYWIILCFDMLTKRYYEIRILDQRLHNIAISESTVYIPFKDRHESTDFNSREWSKFKDIYNILIKFRWELQGFIIILSTISILSILQLSCLHAQEYIVSFFLLAVMTGMFIYSNLRFTIFALIPVISDTNSIGIDPLINYKYSHELTTMFELFNNISNPITLILYSIGVISCVGFFITSLFYLSE